ncbi:MAG: hypothetical protein ABFD82_04230 [Syntrophaceae bacterium]
MKKTVRMENVCFAIIMTLLLLIIGIAPIQAEEARLVTAPAPAAAEEEKPTADFAVSPLTKYLWRGYEMTRDSIVIQPSLTVAYKGFSANLWGNLDTRPYSSVPGTKNSGNWTETDLMFSFTKAFGPVNAGVGYIYYSLNAPYAGVVDPLDSQEIFVTLGLNKLFTPTLTVYKEIDHYHQWYILLGISHAFELSKSVSLKLAASGSYLKSEDAALGKYPKYDGDALATSDKYNNFHDGVITVSLPITPAKYITVTPLLSYVFPLCDDAKNEIKGRGLQDTSTPAERDSSFLYGGVTFDFAF